MNWFQTHMLQKRLGGGSHSTVGTITDIYTLLRLLFSRIGQPGVGASNAFSFNDPEGMCRACNGLGRKLGVLWEDFIDKSKSLSEGAWLLRPEEEALEVHERGDGAAPLR